MPETECHVMFVGTLTLDFPTLTHSHSTMPVRTQDALMSFVGSAVVVAVAEHVLSLPQLSGQKRKASEPSTESVCAATDGPSAESVTTRVSEPGLSAESVTELLPSVFAVSYACVGGIHAALSGMFVCAGHS